MVKSERVEFYKSSIFQYTGNAIHYRAKNKYDKLKYNALTK